MSTHKIIRARRWLLLGVFLFLSVAAADRGVVRTQQGQELLRYGKSYALLVGVSDY